MFASLTAIAPAQAQGVRLYWDPPSSGADVSYVLQYGTAIGTYPNVVPVGFNVTSHGIDGLAPGTYFFVVRAIDRAGLSSAFSTALRVVVPEPQPGTGTSAPPVIPVTTATDLLAAVRDAVPGTAVILEPGTYALQEPLVITGRTDLQIRGRTGKPEDVVLLAPPGWTAPTISVTAATRLTLAGFTLHATTALPIRLGTDVQAPRLERLRIVGTGAFLLSTTHMNGTGARDGVIVDSRFEAPRLTGTMPVGVEVRGGRGWKIQGNVFSYGSGTTVPGPAILAWIGSVDTLVEDNVFVNGSREIVLGMGPGTPNQHEGGVVRNNMIARTPSSGSRGPGISILDGPRAVVAHNTLLLSGTSPVGIEYAHPDTRGVVVVNNVLDATVVARDGATATVAANVTYATATMFVAPATGDLHLRRDGARRVLGLGTPTTYAERDVDGDLRPGVAPDPGADQIVR